MYRFNNVVGRIMRDTQSLGKGLRPITEVESTIIYAQDPKFTTIKSSSSSTTQRPTLPGYDPINPKLVKLYAKYQKDDGVPVHFKAGTQDKILFGITLAGTVLLSGLVAKTLYFMIWPKKE